MIRDDAASLGLKARSAGADQQQQITVDRVETKYLLSPSLVPLLASELSAYLPRHHFLASNVGAPRGHECATTVYFDTAERALYGEAVHSAAHWKVRAREYYVSGARARAREQALVWLEIKHRDGARTRKRRATIAKQEIPRLFEVEAVSAPTLVVAESAHVRCLYSAALRPDCVVHYRRSAWQDRSGALRITIDRTVEFFAPRVDLFRDAAVLTRSCLGKPAASLDSAVVEIKLRGAAPAWLERLLSRHRLAPQPFSKFVAASRAVHG